MALSPRAGTEPNALILHDLASGVTRDLPGTAGSRQPFWSPDASRLASLQ